MRDSHSDIVWSINAFKDAPLQYSGMTILLILRTLYGVFFIGSGVLKIYGGWLTTDHLLQFFLRKILEFEPGSLFVFYIEYFAIPLYVPIAWIVSVGQIVLGVGLLFGLAARLNALFALFQFANFAMGGMAFPQALPIYVLAVLFLVFPTSQWWGLDRTLGQKYPNSLFFRWFVDPLNNVLHYIWLRLAPDMNEKVKLGHNSR